MSNEQLLALLNLYERELRARFQSVPRQYEERCRHGYNRSVAMLDHLLYMMSVMKTSIGGWPEDKKQRWLGFIQGVLWVEGVYSIDELRVQVTTFARES